VLVARKMSFLFRIIRELPRKRFVFNIDTLRHLSLTKSHLHKTSIKDGPGLGHFIANSVSSKNPELQDLDEVENIPYLQEYSGGNQIGM
jgi:hypothetical protein